jgi:hypothetical protein
MYIHTSSNHPPQIIKELPISIGKRLSDNSSNEEIFNQAKDDYEKALKESGYTKNLNFLQNNPPRRRNRQRNIIWFNPPFSKNVETNVAKKFLNLLDKHFPRTNKLNKIFNRNTVKVSYSTTENMKQIINKHNKRILSNSNESNHDESCNCRNKENCAMNGINCRKLNTIYKGVASTTTNPDKNYIGITEGEWKNRHSVHKTSFNKRNHPARTTLSDYVWQMKDHHGETPNIKWSYIKTAPAYNNISKKCALCLQEKLMILEFPDKNNLLNKRSEMVNKCRHQNKFLLKNFKTKKKTGSDVK